MWAKQYFRKLGKQRGVLGLLSSHLGDVRAVVQSDADDLAGGRDHGCVFHSSGVVSGSVAIGGRLSPSDLSQQRADVRSCAFDGAVAVNSHCPCSARGADSSEPHWWLPPPMTPRYW